MSKEIFGLLIMSILFIGSLVISWEIQKLDYLLGYTIGIFGFFASIGIGLNIMTWEKE